MVYTVVDHPANTVFSVVKHNGARYRITLSMAEPPRSPEDLMAEVVAIASKDRTKPLPPSVLEKIWAAAVDVHYTVKRQRELRGGRETRARAADPDVSTVSVSPAPLPPELATDVAEAFDPTSAEDVAERIDRSIKLRRGQPEFRQSLLAAYGGRCAITGCDADAVLEAAHIVAYSGARTNHVQNGLLLRADIHTLFDRHLIAVDTTAWTVVLHPSLMKGSYRSLAGNRLALPKDKAASPSVAALGEHRRDAGF